MSVKNPVSCLFCIMLAATASIGVMQPHENRGGTVLLACAEDPSSAVRFFHNPAESDYYHFPLVFRAVPQGDQRLNTAPMGPEGRRAYVSQDEIAGLIRGLARSGLHWRQSEKVEALGSSNRPLGSEQMQVLVVCSKGTARADIAPAEICHKLAPLDSALRTPRALWEFQGFRLNYGCKVPGFKYDAYPDHY
jgi:hypothetical protein